MTREEAITTLKEMHDSFDEIHENTNYEIGYEQMTATEMAIEALQEVQKHEETFEWCHDCNEYDTDNHCCHRWSKVIRNTVEELKTDRPHGEWQKVEEQPYFRKHYDTVCCSVCRKKGNRKWNFCPNCGADMRGEKK